MQSVFPYKPCTFHYIVRVGSVKQNKKLNQSQKPKYFRPFRNSRKRNEARTKIQIKPKLTTMLSHIIYLWAKRGIANNRAHDPLKSSRHWCFVWLLLCHLVLKLYVFLYYLLSAKNQMLLIIFFYWKDCMLDKLKISDLPTLLKDYTFTS